MSDIRGRIWIQGAGELASGVGWRLFRCGYQVIMAEMANPLAVRRLVAFSEAVFEGRTTVEGVPGQLDSPENTAYLDHRISVVVDPEATVLASLGAAAVIDARITKNTPRPLPHRSALMIGLGPGFRCGRDADLIIETHRGARLGEVICKGTAAPNTGVPGTLGGQSTSRLLRAPIAGCFQADVSIGDIVKQGQVLGEVGGAPVISGLDGQVRGLVHPRAELSAGEKVGDVDPRGQEVDPRLVSDKALAIAGGVLEALLRGKVFPRSCE